jgi:hypothetical protein
VSENGSVEGQFAEVPSFTCPICGRTSYHYMDVQERWCGACHGATGHQPPPGMRWVMLRGGSVDAGRLMHGPLPERYEIIVTGEIYVRVGDEFVLQEVNG